jgi:hypothetical protein
MGSPVRVVCQVSASREDHRVAQGKVILNHQIHHVSTVHVDHRCQTEPSANQVDQDPDVIAGSRGPRRKLEPSLREGPIRAFSRRRRGRTLPRITL